MAKRDRDDFEKKITDEELELLESEQLEILEKRIKYIRELKEFELRNFKNAISRYNKNEIRNHLKKFPNDIDVFDDNTDEQVTSLMKAVFENDLEFVKELIDLGANVNQQDKHGYTAIMIAVNMKSPIFLELLNKGADITIRNHAGVSVINMASNAPSENLRELIVRGADVNTPPENGKDPILVLAIYRNNLENIKILLAAGADPDVRSSSGKTAYECCRTEDCRQILRLHEFSSVNNVSNDVKTLISRFTQIECDDDIMINAFAKNTLNIDISDPRWVNASLDKKCWLAKNMISYDELKDNGILPDRRLSAALNNYESALIQGTINKIPDEFKTQKQIDAVEKRRRDYYGRIKQGEKLFFG